MKRFILIMSLTGVMACQQVPKPAHKVTFISKPVKKPTSSIPDANFIMKRKQVPVLCYHQIRTWRRKDTKRAKECIIPIATFKKHIKMLADSGYHTILPDQYYDYLTKGVPLPAKPIIISFDDGNLDQFTVGKPILDKYGFKAVYFIIANSIGKGHHLKKSQIKLLSDSGNVIANHTLDHPNLARLNDAEVSIQLEKANIKLEGIIKKPVKYVAYPYGIWSAKDSLIIHKLGFKMAFQLSAPRYRKDPLIAIRRIVDDGRWTNRNLYNCIRRDF